MDIYFWLAAFIGVIITGISKSGFAGGAGVVAVPILAFVMPVEHAISVMLPVLIVMDVYALTLYWKQAKWALLKIIIPSAIVGILTAALLLEAMLSNTSEAALLFTIALVAIIFAIWQPLLGYLKVFKKQGLLWGGISGLTSTLVHAGGPPLNIYLMSQSLPKTNWIATSVVFFAVINWVKVIPYSSLGLWTQEQFQISLALLPIALIGIFLGYKIQRHISEKNFMKFCRLLLFASGLGLIIKSLI